MYYSLTVLQATFDNAPAEPGHALLLAGLVLGSVPDQKGNKLFGVNCLFIQETSSMRAEYFGWQR